MNPRGLQTGVSWRTSDMHYSCTGAAFRAEAHTGSRFEVTPLTQLLLAVIFESLSKNTKLLATQSFTSTKMGPNELKRKKTCMSLGSSIERDGECEGDDVLET